MTIKDIASKLGVSPATVSLCLNGKESDSRYCIKTEKAEKIRSYARSHGYIPNAAAVNLRSPRKLPPVGILFNDSHGFERRLQPLHDSIAMLEKHNREYLVLSYHVGRMHKALELLRSQQVTEVVSLGYMEEPCQERFQSVLPTLTEQEKKEWEENLEDWRRVEKLLEHMTVYAPYYRFPRPANGGIRHGLVRMGNNILEFERAVLRKIIDSGLGPAVISRWSGQEVSLVQEGLLPSPEYIVESKHGDNWCEAGLELGFLLAELHKTLPFRTVFYGNDMIASGIITGLVESGIRVPEDVSVLGFGNDDMCACIRVPLSSFDSGTAGNAAKAIRAIVENRQLNDEELTDFQYFERASFRFK